MPDQLSTRAVSPTSVAILPMSSIITGHRFRQDLGDIDELINSIRNNGLIHPLAVKETADGLYQLMAGGRRLEACKRLKMGDVACNIYPADLTQLERNIIELCENIDRKDMSFEEEVSLKNNIHTMMQKLKGVPRAGKSTGGHSMRDTASMLGQSLGSVSEDIKLAKAMEILPELRGCKNKSEASKMLKKMERELENAVTAEKIEKTQALSGMDKVRKGVAQSFILADVFEWMPSLDKNSFDLVELDTPYGIDLLGLKKHDNPITQKYTEWTGKTYLSKLEILLRESYRVMAEDSWLLCWYAIDPWHEAVLQLLRKVGFKLLGIPAIWSKPSGQCNNPELYLPNTYETFFYAKKGSPTIKRMGRSNQFTFKPVYHENKISLAEKPIEMYAEILRTFTDPGSRILSPLAGSGNSLLAAYNIHCTAVGSDHTKSSQEGFVVRAMADGPGGYHSY